MSVIFIAVCVLYSVVSGEWRMMISYAAAIFVHEAGHLAVARLLRVKLHSAEFSPWGMRMRFDFYKVSPIKETTVSLAGSAFGILASFLALILDPQQRFLGDFFYTSLSLSVLNLLPIRNLDGGQILESLLGRYLLPEPALTVFTAISGVFAVGFWIVSVYIQLTAGVNLSLLMISVYFLFSSLIFT